MAAKGKLVGNAIRAAAILEDHFATLPAEQEKRARKELKELAKNISRRVSVPTEHRLKPERVEHPLTPAKRFDRARYRS